jgi:hypothetical protein
MLVHLVRDTAVRVTQYHYEFTAGTRMPIP